MTRLECSVWTNGGTGWGLKVLGGPSVRRANFNAKRGTVTLVLDGDEVEVNIAKKSFWNETCGELIKKEIGDWAMRHGLTAGARVWLRPMQPGTVFAVELT